MTDVNRSTDAEYAEWTANHYAKKVADIATGLRRLADDFERECRPHDPLLSGRDGVGRFAEATRSGFHALTWGIANLHADSLVTDAARADAAAAEIAPSSGS